MISREKTLVKFAASILVFILCFTFVHSAAIKKSIKPQDVSKDIKDHRFNEQKIDVPKLDVKDHNENRGTIGNNRNNIGKINHNNPDSVLQQQRGQQQFTPKENWVKLDQKDPALSAADSALLKPDQSRKGHDNAKYTNKHKFKLDAGAILPVVQDENGAGESILKLVDHPINGKPLPLLKASNKIDAIVQVRDKSKFDGFGKGKSEKLVFRKGKMKLDLDDLQPPDHLDGVRMEQDGHLNRDYKKEIFFGNHEEMESLSDKEMAKKLKQIFKRVDRNRNKYITVDELEDWIIDKVREHFQEAAQENKQVFQALDTDDDGYITWREFHVQFLIKLGMNEKSAEEHAGNGMAREEEDNYDGINNSMQLESDDREKLVRYKLKWSEADSDPQDNQLSLEEFQAFRHPEQSKNMLQNMVQDIIDNLDKNQDGVVSEKEFVALPPAGVGPELHEVDKQWQAERRKEFRNVIDTNRDGKLTKQEILNYVDPQNPNHAKLEARNLIELGDSNKDDRLSLKEVLDNMELFMGSKMVDTGRSFHDEF